MTIYTQKSCKECNKSFLPKHYNAKFCSDSCVKLSQDRKVTIKRLERSFIRYPDTADKNSYVACVYCGYRSSDISGHVQIHNTSAKDYIALYGCTKSEDVRESVRGDKNPAYQHGGKYSPFSKKFIHFTDDKYIEDLVITATKTRMDNNNVSANVDYYLSRGYSEEESLQLLKTRQTTFSLRICIEKYGEIEGTAVWKDRQDRWQNTIMSKSADELSDINKRKSTKINYKTLWNNELDDPGSFYIIKIAKNSYKIGITSRKISSRYKQDDLDKVEILLFGTTTINHAFQIEQILKRSYLHTIIEKDYGPFGWTEVLNGIDIDILLKEANDLLLSPETSDAMFKRKFKNEII